MKKNKSNHDYDKHFWCFIYLITWFPEIYLNKKGLIIYKIAEDKGETRSITKISKFLNVTKSTCSRLCKKCNFLDHIETNVDGNKKRVCFNRDILKKSIEEIKLYK